MELELTATVPYPQKLMERYDRWQQAYYYYYRALPTAAAEHTSALRGRPGIGGNIPVPQTELRSQLAQVGERLVGDLHSWLESGELIDIRRQLNKRDQPQASITLFITCADMELRRLPWETWELTTEFGQGAPIRIARSPVNISVAANPPRQKRRKARALVIIGDDTGLNFKQDLEAIDRLKTLVEIKKIGWQRGKNKTELIDQVRDAIRDPDGWDMLFFFGHSNEAAYLGGEIAIAPQTPISMRDLASDLTEAKRNGLQFALFNSCKGLDIAHQLVTLGLNQVVIMREPIHNQVAQYFLLQFLTRLAQYDDVHTALQKATKALKAEKNMAYPSSYLVPSLFSHRGAELFQLQPVEWRAKLAKLWPTRKQGMALGAISVLSLLPPVRDSLLAGRLWTQAVVHQIVRRPLRSEMSPPVLLVHIDDESVSRGIQNRDVYPINRAYLSQLLDRVVELESQVIGIDYLLDTEKIDNNHKLAASIEKAVDQQSWIVLASWLFEGEEKGPTADLFNPDWSMEAYINAPDIHLKALQMGQDCEGRCPFGYLLAMTQAAVASSAGQFLAPSVEDTTDLRKRLFERIAQNKENDPLLKQLYHYRLSPIMTLSGLFNQRWLQPILDFSIPPDHVYNRLPAHELLNKETSIAQLRNQYDWENQVVLIGAGGYAESGIDGWRDFIANPPAIQFWRKQNQDFTSRFTGVESHAYTIHHLLNRHWVIPVPTLWMVGVGIVVGAVSAMSLRQDKRLQNYRWQGLLVFSLGYGLIGIIMYGAVSIVLPWLLPTAAVWVYHIPALKQSNPEKR